MAFCDKSEDTENIAKLSEPIFTEVIIKEEPIQVKTEVNCSLSLKPELDFNNVWESYVTNSFDGTQLSEQCIEVDIKQEFDVKFEIKTENDLTENIESNNTSNYITLHNVNEIHATEEDPTKLDVKEELGEAIVPQEIEIKDENEIKSESEAECPAENPNIKLKSSTSSPMTYIFVNVPNSVPVLNNPIPESTGIPYLRSPREKPFSCHVCDFKTARKRYLKIHLMTHSGQTPYACDQCDYECAWISNLRRHKRIHLEKKTIDGPFPCDQCNYIGERKPDLKRHKHMHFKPKPVLKGFLKVQPL